MISKRGAVALCLFLSGAGSLVLEVVWGRLLRLVFGSTTLAVSTVLVAYMLGLGIGGLLGGRVGKGLRNGVRAYGVMEIAIAAYAACVPTMLAWMPALSRDILAELSFWPAALIRFVVILLVLLLPTVCMGATLPVLVAALVRGRSSIARSVGLLYGINTLGAVSGVFLATFFLFPTIGVHATNMVGAGLDLLVGLIAVLVLARRHDSTADEPATSAAPAVTTAAAPALARWNPALLAYGTVGFTALVYEVCWTRALSMILGSSIYAFATMLAAFLTGIALGSLIGRRWFDELKRPLAAYGVGLALLGVASFVTVIAFRSLPDVFIELVARLGSSKSTLVSIGVLVSMGAMLGPTLILGALFPLLTRALAADNNSRTVGDVYFVNTIGSAAGAFAAGFVLIPALGLRYTLAVAMAINFAMSGVVILWQSQWLGTQRLVAGAVVAIAAVLLVVAPPQWNAAGLAQGVYRFPGEAIDVGIELLPIIGVPDEQIVYYREGINTTVSVHSRGGESNLRVNGKTDASTAGDVATQVLVGQIPMLFGPRPEKVLIIGFASGMTVGSVALHEPSRLDVIELEPAMLEASHYFDAVNNRPLERPFVQILADDGRVFLANTDERYDLIISEPSNPWITGASNLFTREFFKAARHALAPGGRLGQWVQLYGIDPEGMRSMIAALRSEFPYVYGFLEQGEEVGDLILLASEKPLTRADFPQWENIRPAVQADLQRIEIFSTADIWSLMRMGPADVDRVAAETPTINTDDNMVVELEAPWHLYDFDVVPTNRKFVQPPGNAVLTVLEQAGPALSGEDVGRLALSYAHGRHDAETTHALAKVASERGADGWAQLAEASLGLEPDVDPSQDTVNLLLAAGRSLPEAVEAHLLMGEVFTSIGVPDRALNEADQALALSPGDWRARALRLEALLGLERSAEARIEGEALLASPLSRRANIAAYAAAAAADSGQLDVGLREMRAAVEREPDLPLYWTALAQIYQRAGKPEEAREAAENAQRATMNLILGVHRKALRDERFLGPARAIESLELALQLDPEYEPARRDLQRLTGKAMP